MLLPITQGGHSVISDITLEITSSASDVNILTLATAAGYDATTDTAITVNINNGVTLSGSSGAALNTGALNAASNLTINLLSGSFVHGFTGATSTSESGTGGTGGDAIVFSITSGTGTYAVNVASSSTLGGGSGGGGGPGHGGAGVRSMTCYNDGKGTCSCQSPSVYGATGANGVSGSAGGTGLAQSGTSGTAGATGSSTPNVASTGASFGNPSSNCGVNAGAQPGSAGGSGGSPGKAINFGGLSVTVSNSGTIHGATS